MVDNSVKFSQFEQNGSKALELLRKKAFEPHGAKALKAWNLTEASILIGKSTQAIRENERKGNLPNPNINSKTNKREYSLENINKIREYFSCLPRKPEGTPPLVISFTNFKGGVAKTTSAIHAAHYLTRAGYRTLLIDTDSQASATSSFGYAPDEDIQDSETLLPYFLNEITSVKDIIKTTYWDGLHLIPANLALYGVELELPIIKEMAIAQGKEFKIHNILKRAIAEVSNDYDIVIIDCPPSMSILSTNALYAAKGLIVPCPPELPDVASMFQFFGMISGTFSKISSEPYKFIRILVTKHDGSISSHSITTILRQLYGQYVMRSEMANTQVIKKSRAEMVSIYEIEKYKGSKQTLKRAIQIVDDVNREIEQLIQATWIIQDEANILKESSNV